MKLTNILKVFLFPFSSILFFACGSKPKEALEYMAISKRDTVQLRLNLYEDTFHGSMKILRPGNVIDSGSVEGKIQQDTLIGNFYYHPYGSKFKKRKALVLLKHKDSLTQGSGLESVYMGIPYYLPTSITFDSAGYVFTRVGLK